MPNLIFFLIMLSCMAMILLLVYFTERNEAKPKKGLILGVTLPPEGQQLPEVQAVVARFKKELGFVCLALLAASVLLLWVRATWLSLTLWILLMLGGYAVSMIPHLRANKALKCIKKQHGWQGPQPARRVVDTSVSASLPKPLGPGAVLPPVILSLVPLLAAVLDYTGAERLVWVFLYATDTAAALLLWACGRWMFRRRADMVSGDTALNQTLLRVRHLYWNRCWVLCIWACAGMNLSLWLFAAHPVAEVAAMLAFSLLLVGAVLCTELGVRRAQERLTAGGPPVIADEDDAWLGGILYYNPTDTHAFVAQRVGMGTTINLASRGGRAFAVFSAVLVLATLLIGPALGLIELADTQLTVDSSRLAVTRITEKYSLPLEDITEAELHDALPPAIRTWGTGMDTYLGGMFTVQGYGSCQLCLDPTAPPFLRVKAGGVNYWLGASDPEATRAAAEALQSALAGRGSPAPAG